MITASARRSRHQSGTFSSLPTDSDTCAGIEAFARDVSHDRSGTPRRAGGKKPGILFESRPTETRFLPHESGRLRLTQGVTGTCPRSSRYGFFGPFIRQGRANAPYLHSLPIVADQLEENKIHDFTHFRHSLLSRWKQHGADGNHVCEISEQGQEIAHA